MLREGGGKMELVKSRFTVDNYSLQPIKKQKDLTEHLTMVKKKKKDLQVKLEILNVHIHSILI